MKLSKLLVLSALWLTAGSAMATIVDGVRQAPEVSSTAFTTGSQNEVYYLYNTSAKLFFTQGNTWGTRGCVGPYASAVKMYFSGDDTDGYVINNYVCIRSTSYSWKVASAEAASGGVYCDQSASWGRPKWTVEFGTGNEFRLINTSPITATEDPSPLYLGRDDEVPQDFGNAYSGFTDDGQRYPLSNEITAGEGHHVDWVLVTEADYAGLADVYAVYAKAQELKTVIDEAKAADVDVTDEEAIYLNEGSTIAEMDAAIATVKQKINEAAEQSAKPDNQKDMTSLITNPSYDGGNNGWSGDTPAFGYTAAEFYQKNYNHYQDLENIPNGVYAVKVKGFFRPGFTTEAYAKWGTGKDLNAKLYAKAGEDSLTVAIVNIFEGSTAEKFGVGTEFGENGNADEGQEHYVPNNMQAAEEYFNNGRYQNVLYIGTDDGKLRIGLAKNDANLGGNWSMWDQWELSFLGNSADAFAYWVEEAKKSVPDYSNIEGLYTESYLENYNAIVLNAQASTKAEAVAAMNAIYAAADSLQKNIDLWKTLQTVADSAEIVGGNSNLSPVYTADLADWAQWEAPEILDEHNKTNGELEALIAEIRAMIDEAMKHPDREADVTSYLTNPDFSTDDWTGWTKQAADGGNVAVGSKCCEAWNNAQFDIYQEVKNVPEGVYEISVQGFYRYGRGDTAWNAWLNQDNDFVKSSPCFVYLNAKQTPFMNVFGEAITDNTIFGSHTGYNTFTDSGTTYYAPNDMATAADAFATASEVNPGENMFTQKAYGLVKAGDVMRIGVKGQSNQLNDSWVIFDNFKLTFKGMDATVIGELLTAELEKAEARLTETMGKTAYETLTTAINNAKAAIDEKDGNKMFTALNALFEADAIVTTSVNAFKELATAVDNLDNEIVAAQNQAAVAEAGSFKDDITAKIANHAIDDSEIEGYMNQIAELVTKLRTPDYAGASDASPVDMTTVIVNPEYDEGVSGWSGTEAAWGGEKGALAELFNKNYDYYQEFRGLPAGTYQVSVQAFYRSGSAVNDYATLDSAFTSHAFLYGAAIANGDTLMSAKAIQRLAEIVDFDGYEYKDYTEPTLTDYASVKTDTLEKGTETEYYTYTYVPNMMNTASDAFNNGWFNNNVVTVKLLEGQVLRIGLLKKTHLDQDWTIFDNWKLMYFGAASAKEADGDPTGIETATTAQRVMVEYFMLDGRKAGAAQRGIMIQKMTLENGDVIVRKIRK